MPVNPYRHSVVPRNITPAEALHLLQRGNFRFMNSLNQHRDLLEQVNATKDGQWPFAAVLSCMDSRSPAEIIFDQGLGDIFSIRIAGNVITNGILGSLEYATAVAGSKLILVLGHTSCGAIMGACDNISLGHLTGLLARIRPAVEMEQTVKEDRNSKNTDFVLKVTELNVHYSVNQILSQSEVIRNLVQEGKTGIVPALYDIATGKVHFYNEAGILEAPSSRIGEQIT